MGSGIQGAAYSKHPPDTVGKLTFQRPVPIDFYKEDNYYKYTYGATTDYNEAQRIRNEIKKDFEGAFIVAFRNNEKMELKQAIDEFRKNK